MPRYEIFEGNTANGGATWAWDPITYNSTMDNIRPIVPKWDNQHTALLWMRGTYTTYTNYNMAIVGLTEISPLTGGGSNSGPADASRRRHMDERRRIRQRANWQCEHFVASRRRRNRRQRLAGNDSLGVP